MDADRGPLIRLRLNKQSVFISEIQSYPFIHIFDTDPGAAL